MRINKQLLVVVCGCLGVLGGVAGAYYEQPHVTSWLLVLPIILLVKFRFYGILSLLVFAAFYILPAQHASTYAADIRNMQALYGQELAVTGRIIDDPIYHKSGQKEFHIDNLSLLEPTNRHVSGRIRIRSHNANNVYRGDYISVTGKLFRAIGSRHGTIQYAGIALQARDPTLADKFRQNFFAAVRSKIPEPQSALGLGFLVGGSNALDSELSEDLRTVGLTHIVAVSGYNLTIIVLIIGRLTANSSKRNSLLLSLGLIAFFLLLTCSAPSIVRASIVSGLSLVAWYYGRKFNAIVLLLLSASISVLYNPIYLWKDIGWYLSFAAFFGVLVLAPQATARIYKNTEPKLLGQILIETCCAQLLTLPIIMYIFGDVSVISIMANMLVLPFVPLAMALVFATGMSTMLTITFSGLIALPARWLLGYIVAVTELLAKVSWALVEININLGQLVTIYLLIVAVCFLLYAKNRQLTLKKSRDKIY
jgi:competence protein ComEC